MYAEPTHVVANTCRADYAEPLYAEPLYAEPMYALHHCAQHHRAQHHRAQHSRAQQHRAPLLPFSVSFSAIRREHLYDQQPLSTIRREIFYASLLSTLRREQLYISFSAIRREHYYNQAFSPRRASLRHNSKLSDTPCAFSFHERPVFSWEGVLDSSLCSTNLLQD